MRAYVVITEDRHIDTAVEIFLDKEMAIGHAKGLARSYAQGYPNEYEEYEVDTWLFCVHYSCENDRIRVVEVEVHGLLSDM